MLSRELLAELKAYLVGLGKLGEAILDGQDVRPPAGRLLEIYLKGQAASLSDWYSSCERIFERIAVELNGSPPEGIDWHRTLIERMALEIPRIRPAVVTHETREDLDELRRFRHAMRHLYGASIDSRRLQTHLDVLGDLNRRLVDELSRFLAAMEAVLDQAESRSDG